MKKNILIFILGGLLFSSITATAAYVYTARDIGYTPSDENWSVTNADQALSSLKSDVNDLNQYRSDIVQSLVDKGVDVNENSSMADIKNGIDNMSTETHALIFYNGYFSEGNNTHEVLEINGDSLKFVITAPNKDIITYENDYFSITMVSKYAYWYHVTIKAKKTGKYKIIGTNLNKNEEVEVNAGDTLLITSSGNNSTVTVDNYYYGYLLELLYLG